MNYVVFIEGSLFSGKTAFIETFGSKHIEDAISASAHVAKAVELMAQSEVDLMNMPIRRCTFPTEETTPLRQLYVNGQLSNEEYNRHVQALYMRKIKKTMEGANRVILVLENNPIYTHWIRVRTDTRYGAVADADVIYAFMQMKLTPLMTFFLVSNGVEAKPAELFAEANARQINYRVAIAHSYISRNHGFLLKTTRSENGLIIEHRQKPKKISDTEVNFIDANIGVGKTTLIIEAADMTIPVVEPIDEIAKILVLDIDRAAKEDAIEYECTKAIANALRENDDDISLSVERNLFYSKWIFDDDELTVPRISPTILRLFEQHGLSHGHTLYLRASPEQAQKRSQSRGRECDLKWTIADFERIHSRLEYLYNGPYEWPYAECIVMNYAFDSPSE